MGNMQRRNVTRRMIIFLLLTFLMIGQMLPAGTVVYAEDMMTEYKNPGDIVIASPKNGYTTTASKVSILGASDYNYPVYMNGEQIETTEYGFFTVYVDLEVGENEFMFLNGEGYQVLTIIRKKTSSSSGTGSSTGSSGGSAKVTYKEYTTDAYGVITGNYAMPRTKISESDVSLMPITKGTMVRVLGEDKSYYKIVDGTFVSKSSMTLYKEAITNNKVTKAVVKDDATNNVVRTTFTANVSAMHAVTLDGNKVYLTLYDTTSAKKPTVKSNDTVKSVTVSVDKEKKTATYCYHLYEGATVTGYDINFGDGTILFELKKAPHLKEKGSLKGAVVYLDAGHGGSDTGALGPLSTLGPTEKHINLAITMYAKKYLEDLGATVVITRGDDTFLSLSDRVASIRSIRPDISVSVHGNSLGETSNYSASSGLLMYYSYTMQGDVPSQINKSLATTLGFTEKATRRSSLSLTRFTTCPSVLIETSFLSNPFDYEYLIKVSNQLSFGNAIGEAVKEYLESIAVYENEEIIHVVAKGETLSAIARKYGVSLSEIIKWNNVEDINHIVVGQKLRIFTTN